MTEASSKAASDEKAEIQRLRRQVTVDQAEIRRLTKLNEQLIERVDLAERVAETQAAASTRSAMMRIQQAQTEFDATLAESHARRKEASEVIERLRAEIERHRAENDRLGGDMKKLKDEAAKAQADNKGKAQFVEKLKAERAELNDLKRANSSEIKTLKNALDQRFAEIAQLQKEILRRSPGYRLKKMLGAK